MRLQKYKKDNNIYRLFFYSEKSTSQFHENHIFSHG